MFQMLSVLLPFLLGLQYRCLVWANLSWSGTEGYYKNQCVHNRNKGFAFYGPVPNLCYHSHQSLSSVAVFQIARLHSQSGCDYVQRYFAHIEYLLHQALGAFDPVYRIQSVAAGLFRLRFVSPCLNEDD